MTLKAVLDEDQFGELDESHQGLYREQDGKYVLDVDDVDNFPTVHGLKTGHIRSKKERDQYRDQFESLKRKAGPLADFDDIDLSDADPERLESLLPYLTGEREIPSGDGGPKVDVDKIKANAVKPFERKLSEAEQTAEQYKGLLHKHVRDSALTSALSKSKVAEPYFDAAMAMFRSRIKVVEDDGNLIPMIEDDATGEMPVDKYIKEWAQTDQGKAFIEATGNQGGGSRGSGASGKIKNPWSPDNWNMSEQGRIYREDPERARKMAAEYGKKVT
ncbi:MAG: hypothetical protein GVY36_19775 [Verrucomicrobia bacterium]|jgi:hypothetical protein|nr:hypothetical protein [Verrucomicrobiota bacterium]